MPGHINPTGKGSGSSSSTEAYRAPPVTEAASMTGAPITRPAPVTEAPTTQPATEVPVTETRRTIRWTIETPSSSGEHPSISGIAIIPILESATISEFPTAARRTFFIPRSPPLPRGVEPGFADGGQCACETGTRHRILREVSTPDADSLPRLCARCGLR